MQFGPGGAHNSAHIMTRCQAIGAELARHAEQVGEFRPHVAADTGDGRTAGEIFVGELLDDFLAKCAFMVEHVMRDPEPVGHCARIADIVARAAGTLAPGGGPVIIELQRDADHLGPAGRSERGDDRGIDAAAHRHDDAAFACRLGQVEKRRGVEPGVEESRLGHDWGALHIPR